MKVKIKITLLFFSLMFANIAISGSTLDAAYSSFQDERFQRALILYSNAKGFSARMGEGSSAYRLNDFKYAIKQFTLALLKARNDDEKFKSLYNLANSYYKANEFIKAIETYKYLLVYKPDSEDAQSNLWSAQSMLIDNIKHNRIQVNKESVNYDDTQDENLDHLLDKDEKISKTEKIGYLRTLIGDRVAEGELNAIAQNDDSMNILVSEVIQIKNYLSAVKKLEFVNDNPQSILKSIVDYESKN